MSTLTSPDVCRRAHISYRQLDHWIRSGYVECVTKNTPGSGTRRTFTEAEAIRVRLMSELIGAGLAPAMAYRATLRGEYDGEGTFRAHVMHGVWVEVRT